ncbi:uncharacterized protein LOC119571838 [Penaeus monodon]|uniref:uncharacterized protein LOC119571838 n=1 Tax=Penaeus monodon TaxID=6687 RepID=UPI0018A6FC90|nr:uncharacterized protein LOC119571838 [Penaeus monodon]
MLQDVTTRVSSTVGMTEHFKVKVGLHQGSALSPLLFNIVFDVITDNVREEPPWCVLYADDIVLVTESRRVPERKLEEWSQNSLNLRPRSSPLKKLEEKKLDVAEMKMFEMDGWSHKKR